MTRRDPAQAGPESAGNAPHDSTGHVKQWHPKPLPVGTILQPRGVPCRQCGKLIRFRLTAKGLNQPMELDGSDVHFHRKPRATRCPRCSSELFETLYRGGETFIPEPHFGKATCSICGASWWVGR